MKLRILLQRKRLSRAAFVLAASLFALPVAATGATDTARTATAVPALAYVTGTAQSPSAVWIASAAGGERTLLGPGLEPLMSPNGQYVAAVLFGTQSGSQEKEPALAVYSTLTHTAIEYFSLATGTAAPLAWSPDSRYLAVQLQSNAVTQIAQRSSLAVIDTGTGTVATIMHGQIDGASFARDGSDRIVFGRAPSPALSAPPNLYVSRPDGSQLRRFTNDGHSLYPVWGPGYIAYDREHQRREGWALQIWIAPLDGRAPYRLTRVAVNPLQEGLLPVAISADGSRLVAQFVGEDFAQAWAVQVPSGRARALTGVDRLSVAAGISSDGRTALVDEDALEGPPSGGHIVTVPFLGGHPTLLVAHAGQGSWSG